MRYTLRNCKKRSDLFSFMKIQKFFACNLLLLHFKFMSCKIRCIINISFMITFFHANKNFKFVYACYFFNIKIKMRPNIQLPRFESQAQNKLHRHKHHKHKTNGKKLDLSNKRLPVNVSWKPIAFAPKNRRHPYKINEVAFHNFRHNANRAHWSSQ